LPAAGRPGISVGIKLFDHMPTSPAVSVFFHRRLTGSDDYY
jgi:hypothetical protein